MADDRIGELRIRIRTASAGDEQALRREAEQFARSVLERALQVLDARAPGRLIFLRRLPLQWRLTEDALGDGEHVEELAKELAEDLEQSLPPASDAPSASADAVVFRDEPHHLASYLVARARGERAWFHRNLEQGAGFEDVAASQRAAVHQALELLAARGALAEVLASMPPREVQVLTEGFESLSPVLPASPGAEESAAGTTGALSAELRRIADTYRALPALTRALALHVEARRIAGPGASGAEVARTLRTAWGAGQPHAPTTGTRGPPSREALGGDDTAREASARSSRDAADVTEGASRRDERQGDSPSSSANALRSGPRDTEDAAPTEAEVSPSPMEAIRFGGLLFLLNPLLELEIAEALWKACLPEGEVLAYLARELLGSQGEQDAALIGGVAPPERPPEISPEQQAEFTSSIVTQIVAALPRRGLASLPEVVVGLHEHPAGRLLCASAMGSPFALFAWPAESRDGITLGLSQFLAAWPASIRLHGSPALATLAPTGRLRPLTREHRPVPLHLPRAATPTAAALLAQAIGAPCQLLLSRSGERVDSADAFTARFLARPARVSLPAGQMRVTFLGGTIDVTLRKPGLDRDPGWVTWLERTVRFEFETDAF